MTSGQLAVPFAALCWALSPAAAQRTTPLEPERDNRPSIAFMAGPAPYDLAGTGTGGFGAVRLEFPTGRFLVIEPGVSIFRYTSQLDESITYVLPEVGIQAQVPGGPVRPYLGGGIGFSEFLSGRGSNDLTMHAALGLRAAVGGGWGVRGEARIRAIDPFVGNTVDLGVGVTRKLRSP